MTTTDVIILAAKAAEGAECDFSAVDGCKSLVPVRGHPAVSHLMDSLKRCEAVSRVILVSHARVRDAAPDADLFIEARGDETEAIAAGMRAAQDAERCLLMTGDMALVSSESLSDMLASAPDSDLVYPVVGKADVQRVFPGRKPYYVDTKEGSFTGSSLLLFNPRAALSSYDALARLLAARRHPTMLLGLLGAGFAFKMMFSRLSLRDFEQTLSRALGLEVRAFVSRHPELFVSIDSAADIELMERELGLRN